MSDDRGQAAPAVAEALAAGARDDHAALVIDVDCRLLADRDPGPLDNRERQRDLALRGERVNPLRRFTRLGMSKEDRKESTRAARSGSPTTRRAGAGLSALLDRSSAS
jgi:hypothetical protein